ncbi:hypothetical protein FHU36_004241 [Nonomuraea muscovyensis]|uniref:Resolvase/invertase-type recombinase catalytic domain-containing protein n=1 Tax=Nonomuraea muscovyensis TaxID=1124761 RepID=A0A7X0C5W5_9ACTN|nr:recombinase family protein [Nonomuraea muscovyensis]MBB6347696.1 hypothetical protein [Nonomuraea muscovyensis]
MALIGLVRVSTDKQNTQRQHDALDPICWKVFEEKISGKLATDDRPALLNALSNIRDGDLLTFQEVDRLGRNLLEGLIVLNDLSQRGVGVKVLEGIAAGEHTERSLILDLALALAEDRHPDKPGSHERAAQRPSWSPMCWGRGEAPRSASRTASAFLVAAAMGSSREAVSVMARPSARTAAMSCPAARRESHRRRRAWISSMGARIFSSRSSACSA